MLPDVIRYRAGTCALAGLLMAPLAVVVAAHPVSTAAMAQLAASPAIDDYRRKLADYQAARAAYEQQAGAYWSAIAEKRRGRNAKRREHAAIGLDD